LTGINLAQRGCHESPVDIAFRSDTLCNLRQIAIKLNRKLRWDPVKEEFVNEAEVQVILDRPMRSPWHICMSG